MNMKKTLYFLLGCIGLTFGMIGAILPILPTVPFLMLAAFSFSRTSEKWNRWFQSTKLYQNHFKPFVAGHGMTWKTKIRIMITVTLLMSIGFIMMGTKGITIGCIVLGFIWFCHVLYFCFAVKTIPTKRKKVRV